MAAIREAAGAIRGRIHRTPLLTSASLARRLADRHGSEPSEVLLKAESLQKTGSFKARGVLNRVRRLSPEERRRGLITISAGNHAAALAPGARVYGVEPEGAPGLTRALEGGRVVRLESVETIAGGLAPPSSPAGPWPFQED